MAVLVTGGLGYIGSHFVCEALIKGKKIVVVDNLSNSEIEIKEKIKRITNKDFHFYHCDIRDKKKLEYVFKKHNIKVVIHFAGLKSVSESVEIPNEYFENNVLGTSCLIEVMNNFNVNKIVFSSSASIYGDSPSTPIKEDAEIKPLNPYAKTKSKIEENLLDENIKNKNFKFVILRYFNPVGCHKSYLIGESPLKPSNLFPIINEVIAKKREKLIIYGKNYNTFDGTPIRDYIHISDLIDGHLKALAWLDKKNNSKLIINLGTGKGYSVLQIVREFEKILEEPLNYEFSARRKGDAECSFADCNLAKKEIKWHAKKDLTEMCKDSIIWAKLFSSN